MIDPTIYNDIRAALAAAIETSDNIGSVHAFPTTTLTAFPAVVVHTSENLADYGTTYDQRFVFAFTIRILYPVKKESEQERAERAIGNAVGEILSILSGKDVVAGVDWVEPIPSVWGDATVAEAVYRTADINIRCIRYLGVR